MLTDSIKPHLFFLITYLKKSTGEIEKYIIRTGVRRWKNFDGSYSEVKGIGHPSSPHLLKAYCSNRKCYRTFIVDNILHVKQGDIDIDFTNKSGTR